MNVRLINVWIVISLVLSISCILLPLPSQGIDPVWIYYTGKERPLQDVHMTRDGMNLYAADGTLYVISREGTLRAQGMRADTVESSPDDTYVVTGSKSDLCVYTTQGTKEWCSDGVPGGAIRVSSTADGAYIYAASGTGGRIFYFARDGTSSWNVFTGSDIYELATPRDGSFVVEVGGNEILQSFDNKGNVRFVRSQDRGNGLISHAVAVSENGLTFAVGTDTGNYGAVILYDRWANVQWRYPTQGWARQVSISQNGTFIAAGDWVITEKRSGSVYFLDKSGDLLWKYGTSGYISSLRMTPEGSYVLAGTSDGMIYYFKGDGSLLWTKQIGAAVSSLYLSETGSEMLAGTESGDLFFFRDINEVTPAGDPTSDLYLEPWWDGDVADSLSWECRIPVTLVERKGQDRVNVPVVLQLSDVFGQNFSYSDITVPSIRVIDPKSIPDEPNEVGGNDVDYQIDDRTNDNQPSDNDYIIFTSSVRAFERKNYYVYFSVGQPIPSKRYLPIPYNSIVDPNFEHSENASLSHWITIKNNQTLLENDIDRGSVRLSAVNQTDAITVSQFINFTPPEPLEAVHFGAWIKSMNVSWPSDRNLSVYINMYYPTGGATYGLANNGTPAPIDPGTYDWRFFEATVTPDSPLREVSLHVGMKNHTGTIWADDVELIKVYYLMKVGATQWKYLYTEPTSIPPTTMEGETQTPPTTAAGGFGLPLVFVAFIILFVIGFGRKILRRRK